jgi:hypothetical protein
VDCSWHNVKQQQQKQQQQNFSPHRSGEEEEGIKVDKMVDNCSDPSLLLERCPLIISLVFFPRNQVSNDPSTSCSHFVTILTTQSMWTTYSYNRCSKVRTPHCSHLLIHSSTIDVPTPLRSPPSLCFLAPLNQPIISHRDTISMTPSRTPHFFSGGPFWALFLLSPASS